MKFQDSSFNGLKVTVGTKSVTHARTHPRTHAPKAICPINFFKVGGITIGGVWGAIANKMEASQETCFLGKITQASLQIIKWYMFLKRNAVLFEFYESLCREIGKKLH